MTARDYISKFRAAIGVSKGEFTAVMVLVAGLILYSLLQLFGYAPGLTYEERKRLAALFDSLATADKSTYVGSDVYGASFDEYAAGDTLVKRGSFFKKSDPKKLPSTAIDLNSASKLELTALPGVGEQTAIAIIKYRNKYGFDRPEDLMNVRGIGEKKFEKIKPFVKAVRPGEKK